ncbi:hypothetical protein LGL08_20140 [Clostridium estertheticum]|uniref:hypothetical protein n=1 Tax=Clostridium estertheticum TaxID=238834 RepID=UPI001CF444C1|nr:hypothetical protein [Clostridium estertheticum]MCB2309016.1 hypothetical protein [Clostridium estertheticum]MCB2346850.1 hypothetical protein [Clostridium estertheticum]MCB2351838.1 hypothetical protein [Clostridium estertheticum]WAG48441.1 hypothetical protein LL127_22945 [Clostridium estertheticum]
MSKQFVKDNVYVFTTKKFKSDVVNADTKKGTWAAEINGHIVDIENRMCRSYGIDPEWCKCIKNNNPKIESESI